VSKPAGAYIALTDNQEKVIDALRSLPDADIVRIESNIDCYPNGVTRGHIKIRGGFNQEFIKDACETCGRHDNRNLYVHFTFFWDAGKFKRVDICRSGGLAFGVRRNPSMTDALKFIDKLKEHYSADNDHV